MTAYAGALTRSARFERYTPVAGVSEEHTHPDPEPDPFDPSPSGVRPAAYDVWQPEDVSVHTEMRARAFEHWAHVAPPVAAGVPQVLSQLAQQARMLANHGQVDPGQPDTSRKYRHASQGRSIEVTPGRMPWQSGEEVPEGSAYLQAGTNAYDRTNLPNEVYGGDAANVGRYRLGNGYEMWGLYTLPGKVGLDTQLRAATGLAPQFPVDKPRLMDTAPYTPSSRGTDTWTLSSWQIPSLFGVPSETVMTDREVAQGTGYFTGGGFDDRGRL